MSSVIILGLAAWSLPNECHGYDEVWTINNAHSAYGLETDLIIAMDDFGRDFKTHPDYVREMVDSGIPVLSTKEDERWPTVKAYPLQEVCDWLSEFYPEPERILDNTCNYAFALALKQGRNPIGIYGFEWVNRYKQVDLDCAMLRWKDNGFDPPDWFKYYEADVLARRRPGEPGIESFHFLFGVAMARGVELVMGESRTILNHDRDRFFYGYHEQPNVT